MEPELRPEFIKELLESQNQETIKLDEKIFTDEKLLVKGWLTKDEDEKWKDL